MNDSVSETHDSAHDPLCHEAWDHEFTDDQPCGICAAIAKGRENMLAKCIAAVEALPDVADDAREADLRQMYCSCEEWDCYCEHRGKAQAALTLRALRDQRNEFRNDSHSLGNFMPTASALSLPQEKP